MEPGTIVTRGKLASTGGIQGVPGTKGDKGDIGEQGLIEEAPADNVVYGRKNGEWVHAIAGTGDVMTGNLIVKAGEIGICSANWATLWLSNGDGSNPSHDSFYIQKAKSAGDKIMVGCYDIAGAAVWNGHLVDSYHYPSATNAVSRAGDTITGTLTVTGNVTNNAALTVRGTLYCTGGRVISQGLNNNPSFCSYNTAGYACGMFCGGGGELYLAQMHGDGSYANWYAIIKGSGSTWQFPLTCNATIQSNNGHIISCRSGAATVCVWDTSQRSSGLWQNVQSCYLGNMSAAGDYIGDWWWHADNDYTFTVRYGIRYPHAGMGTNNYFAFGWNLWGGSINGSVDNGAVSYPFASASDSRMKQDIAPSRLDCLAMLEQLPLVEYRWREFPKSPSLCSPAPGFDIPMAQDPWRLREAKARDDAPLKRVGLIAQQIAKIFPDGILEGDDFDDHPGRVWSIDHNNMLALCIGAIQQLQKEIVMLKKRI
jgi:hypothetical protein